jgi:hypothetical protein
MYVVPAAGLTIPDPAMQGTPDYYLPPEGREVQPSGYWTRRLIGGDVTELVTGEYNGPGADEMLARLSCQPVDVTKP